MTADRSSEREIGGEGGHGAQRELSDRLAASERARERLAAELRVLRETIAALHRDLDLAEVDRITLENRVATLSAEVVDSRLAEVERREPPPLPALPAPSRPLPPEPPLPPPSPVGHVDETPAEGLVWDPAPVTASFLGAALLDTMSD